MGLIEYEEIACPCCGKRKTHTRYRKRIQECSLASVWYEGVEYPIQDDQQIVACQSCGLVYVNPRIMYRPGLFPYNAASEDHYFTSTADARERVYQHFFQQIPDWLGRTNGQLLDIGCGDGGFLRAALAHGFQGTGYEVSQGLQELIRRTLPLVTLVDQLDTLPDKQFDIVAIISVLEHVYHPSDLLRTVRRVLRDDGIAIIQVPNIGSRRAWLQQDQWKQIEPLGHLTYFTYETLNRILRRNGLQIKGLFAPSPPAQARFGSGIRTALAQSWIRFATFWWDDDLGFVVQRCPE
jgi:2-polyprenyl-3-methyl-5-hydroxy-6-metoxy-1,4-benzoquinol methylase